jgi:hypothetical protein
MVAWDALLHFQEKSRQGEKLCFLHEAVVENWSIKDFTFAYNVSYSLEIYLFSWELYLLFSTFKMSCSLCSTTLRMWILKSTCVLPIQILIYEYLHIGCLVIKFILWQGQKAYLACTSTPRSEWIVYNWDADNSYTSVLFVSYYSYMIAILCLLSSTSVVEHWSFP